MSALGGMSAEVFKAVEARALTPGRALSDISLKEGVLPQKEALIQSQAEAQAGLSESLATPDTISEARDAVDRGLERNLEAQTVEGEKLGSLKDSCVKEYEQDLKRFSLGCEGTLNAEDFRVIGSDENKVMRSEFNREKPRLIGEWEQKRDQSWPRYSEDVYDEKTGTKIRCKGDLWDAHHKQPLEFGGKNTADNLTPMHARDHYDHRGIHAKSDTNALHRLGELCHN